MSVLIKGMEMPKSCDVCPLITETDDYHVCYINEQFIPWEWINEHSAEQRHPKPSWCPLVEIPPHGRLIDVKSLENMNFTDGMYDAENKLFVPFVEVASAIFDAPTIIESEAFR